MHLTKFLTPITLAAFLAAALVARAADFDIHKATEFKLTLLATGLGFVEGPQWFPDHGGYLVFSDIPGNELKKWTKADGLTTFRKPSQNANGNTRDLQGRLVTAEHSGRRVSVTEKDGTVKTLVDNFAGKKFNSPNDVVVKSDGSVWFTDPDYGLQNKAAKELPGHFVFRLEPATGKLTAVAKDFDKPNGLCFSPDEKRLYIADSGKPRHIRVFTVQADDTLADGKVFCVLDKGAPDGIRCDTDGRVWSSAGDGVHIFAPDGTLLGKILTPETPANLCFGGPNLATLYLTARKSLYSIETAVKGIR